MVDGNQIVAPTDDRTIHLRRPLADHDQADDVLSFLFDDALKYRDRIFSSTGAGIKHSLMRAT
ncbi:hypothetical protein [Bradyrhizobium elkanii]|uniref:hypothetical protein n=1 Tax=Bradyrhizobium elkanii TaxID=29448 RepID=UPI001485A2FA|nr:hypothetical protein [Bradyrhizobium elkanii]